VTEILHGVLNDASMMDLALFYFRNPAYVESLDESERETFLESPTEKELKGLSRSEARRCVRERVAKLRMLKDRIRTSGVRVRENYPDLQSLGELVLKSLTQIIENVSGIMIALDKLGEIRDDLSVRRSRGTMFSLFFGGVRHGSSCVRDKLSYRSQRCPVESD